MLKIRFLGKFYFEKDGRDITAAINNKTAAIVALLLIQKNKTMSREKIISYLWPDSSEDAARYNLRYNLWLLKKVINADEDENEFLLITKDYCSINAEYNYICDIVDIISLKLNEEKSIQRLEYYFALFNGDFFEGCYFSNCEEFNEIIIFQRNYFEKKKLSIINYLARQYYSKGLLSQCIEALNTSLSIDPYDEKNGVLMLDAYIKANNRGAAVKFYNTMVNRLACDLNIEPSEILKKKFIEIEDQESSGQSQTDSNKISILSYCIKEIPCFWMSEVIDKILIDSSFDIEKYLNRDDISDLAYIQANLGECKFSPSVARVANSFIKLIKLICLDNNLEIIIINSSLLDEISKGVVKHLKEIQLKNLNIIEDEM